MLRKYSDELAGRHVADTSPSIMSSSLGDFGKLPAELRDQIFLLVVQDKVHNIEPFPILPLSQTSQTIRSEVLPVFYQKGSFQYVAEVKNGVELADMAQFYEKSNVRRAAIQDRPTPSPVLFNVEIMCRDVGACKWSATATIANVGGKQSVKYPDVIRRGERGERIMKGPNNENYDGRRDKMFAEVTERLMRLHMSRSRGVSLDEIIGMGNTMHENIWWGL